MCYSSVKEIESDAGDTRSKSGNKKLASNPLFKEVAKALEQQRQRQPDPRHPDGFSMHPKMQKAKNIIVNHFTQGIGENEANSATNGGSSAHKNESRVIVFVTFREAVEEIVQALNFERPLIRATKFVGQGLDKKGGRGLAQKEQIAVSGLPCSGTEGEELGTGNEGLMFRLSRPSRASRRGSSMCWWRRPSERRAWISVRLT